MLKGNVFSLKIIFLLFSSCFQNFVFFKNDSLQKNNANLNQNNSVLYSSKNKINDSDNYFKSLHNAINPETSLRKNDNTENSLNLGSLIGIISTIAFFVVAIITLLIVITHIMFLGGGMLGTTKKTSTELSNVLSLEKIKKSECSSKDTRILKRNKTTLSTHKQPQNNSLRVVLDSSFHTEAQKKQGITRRHFETQATHDRINEVGTAFKKKSSLEVHLPKIHSSNGELPQNPLKDEWIMYPRKEKNNDFLPKINKSNNSSKPSALNSLSNMQSTASISEQAFSATSFSLLLEHEIRTERTTYENLAEKQINKVLQNERQMSNMTLQELHIFLDEETIQFVYKNEQQDRRLMFSYKTNSFKINEHEERSKEIRILNRFSSLISRKEIDALMMELKDNSAFELKNIKTWIFNAEEEIKRLNWELECNKLSKKSALAANESILNSSKKKTEFIKTFLDNLNKKLSRFDVTLKQAGLISAQESDSLEDLFRTDINFYRYLEQINNETQNIHIQLVQIQACKSIESRILFIEQICNRDPKLIFDKNFGSSLKSEVDRIQETINGLKYNIEFILEDIKNYEKEIGVKISKLNSWRIRNETLRQEIHQLGVCVNHLELYIDGINPTGNFFDFQNILPREFKRYFFPSEEISWTIRLGDKKLYFLNKDEFSFRHLYFKLIVKYPFFLSDSEHQELIIQVNSLRKNFSIIHEKICR